MKLDKTLNGGLDGVHKLKELDESYFQEESRRILAELREVYEALDKGLVTLAKAKEKKNELKRQLDQLLKPVGEARRLLRLQRKINRTVLAASKLQSRYRKLHGAAG